MLSSWPVVGSSTTDGADLENLTGGKCVLEKSELRNTKRPQGRLQVDALRRPLENIQV